MAFKRRLPWTRLPQLGLKLVPSEFRVVHKPLVYGFKSTPVGSAPPDTLTKVRLRQFYQARRLDTAVDLVTLLHHRMRAKAGVVVPMPVLTESAKAAVPVAPIVPVVAAPFVPAIEVAAPVGAIPTSPTSPRPRLTGRPAPTRSIPARAARVVAPVPSKSQAQRKTR